MHHRAAQEPAPAEQRRGPLDIALHQRGADRRGGDRFIRTAIGFHDLDDEAAGFSALAQQSGGTGPAPAEMEVPADHDAAKAETVNEDVVDEGLRRRGGEIAVERQHHRAGEPAFGEKTELYRLVGEAKDRCVGAEHVAGVRLEGEHRAGPAKPGGQRPGAADHHRVAAVNAVKIADRHHGAGKRTLETPDAAHGSEVQRRGGVRGRRNRGHQVSGIWPGNGRQTGARV